MVTYDKTTTRIQVTVGESFVLALPASTTGGYRWEVIQEPEVARLAAERIVPGTSAAGSRSTHELEFVATSPGAGRLVLAYRRPWEQSATERLEMTVVAE
jgi:predicted secreted protein